MAKKQNGRQGDSGAQRMPMKGMPMNAQAGVAKASPKRGMPKAVGRLKGG